MENSSLKTQSLLTRDSTIKEKVDLNKSKNIFGFILKKTGNPLLNQAKQKAQEYFKYNFNLKKRTQNLLEHLNRDKIDELRSLQINIARLSPQTISSRSSISDLPEIDFNDEEGYEKIMREREEHEKQRQERKRKKKEEEEKLKK